MIETEMATEVPHTSIATEILFTDSYKNKKNEEPEQFSEEIFSKQMDHTQLLPRLLKELKEIDFKILAFPQITMLKEELKKYSKDSDEYKEAQESINRFKVSDNHYLILTIENLLSEAKRFKWSICMNNGSLFVYNGGYWVINEKASFQKFLGLAAERMSVPKFRARFYKFRENLFKQFLATAVLPTPIISTSKVLINLQNGTFEINPGRVSRLREFDMDDFLTYQLPFSYDPLANAPIFEKYLNRVLPDKNKQLILAEYLGFIFIKNGNKLIKEEKTLILYGSGANGKSVLYEVVNALLGPDNVSSYSLQSLTNESGYSRAKLGNKLLNYASEINGKLESSVFKQLASGEPIETRLPYGEPIILSNYAKLMFNCNSLPSNVEHSHAFFRRFLIIEFDVTIPECEYDKELHNKIINNELSGVFNWVLAGLDRLLLQKGFTECEAVKKALAEYQKQSDPLRLFLDENDYKHSSSELIPLQEIYAEFRSYCNANGYNTITKHTFSDRLKNLKYNSVRRNSGMMIFIEKNVVFQPA